MGDHLKTFVCFGVNILGESQLIETSAQNSIDLMIDACYLCRRSRTPTRSHCVATNHHPPSCRARWGSFQQSEMMFWYIRINKTPIQRYDQSSLPIFLKIGIFFWLQKSPKTRVWNINACHPKTTWSVKIQVAAKRMTGQGLRPGMDLRPERLSLRSRGPAAPPKTWDFSIFFFSGWFGSSIISLHDVFNDFFWVTSKHKGDDFNIWAKNHSVEV